jgi:hypothetical protein
MAIIEDGKGTGISTQVTNDFMLRTRSVTIPIASRESDKGVLFGFGSGIVALPADFDGPVVWWSNDNDTKWIYVDKLIFGFNGGNTTTTNTIESVISYGGSSYSTNTTAVTAFPDNQASNARSETTILKWNGTGSAGMSTQTTAGTAAIPNIIGPGNTTLWDIAGQIILGPSDTMEFGITDRKSEASRFVLSVIFYEKEALE